MRFRALILGLLALGFVFAAPASAGEFEQLKSQVKEYRLDNGLTFLVIERPDAPVFSFRTYVDAGGVDELPGITGIAHMFEHMAFKGTPTIGGEGSEAEMEAIAAEDAAWNALEAELNKGNDADPERLAELEEAFQDAQAAAQEFVIANDYSKILNENGVTGLNASTFTDWTQYYYNLPSNRFELWARMEGDRMTNPVLREFYKERDVVYEERRFQESSPTGRLFLNWINAAYEAHPYGIGGVIGHSADLKRIDRDDAREFFEKYYVGSNMTVAVVGDVKYDDVKKYADKYFSGVLSGEDPPPVRTMEPRHDYEVRVVRREDAQPIVLIGYHIPSRLDADWFAYELLGDIVGMGRSSRLYKRLVKEDKIAAQTFAGSGFLGNKYPALLLVQALVSKDATVEDVEAAIYEELDRLATEGPTPDELAKVKTMNKAQFIRSIRSNAGLAAQLAETEEKLGDWRRVFSYLDEMQAVTVEDVQKAAQEALRPDNRIVGILKRPEEAESPEPTS
jgi:predicted Zn-dependent peptidase